MTARRHIGAAGTLNLGDGPTATKLEGILRMIAFGGVTLLGMQEGSDRTKMLAGFVELLKHPAVVVRRYVQQRRQRATIREQLAAMSWRVFTPPIPGGKAVPIAYDAKVWKLLRTRSILAVARTWVGAVGAGPTWAKPKVVAVLVVRHRETGEVVEHLNTHMIPSADRGNLPPREEAARHRHYAKQAAAVVQLVRRAERRGHGVVVTMDANAARLSHLIKPFRDADLIGWTTKGTHGARGIDHVLTVAHGVVAGTPAKVLFLQGFDHRGVVRDLYAKVRAA